VPLCRREKCPDFEVRGAGPSRRDIEPGDSYGFRVKFWFDKAFLSVIEFRVLLDSDKGDTIEQFVCAVLPGDAGRRRVDLPWTFGGKTDVDVAGFSDVPKASEIDRGPFHFITALLITRRIMDFWLQSEIRKRRDDALENARRSRLTRYAASGRSTWIRIRIAEGAQAISDALAALARSLRNGETV
jgi:hypothetical protein